MSHRLPRSEDAILQQICQTILANLIPRLARECGVDEKREPSRPNESNDSHSDRRPRDPHRAKKWGSPFASWAFPLDSAIRFRSFSQPPKMAQGARYQIEYPAW